MSPQVAALGAGVALAGATLTGVLAVRPALPELRYRMSGRENFSLGWEWYELLLRPDTRRRTLSLSADALVLFICGTVILWKATP